MTCVKITQAESVTVTYVFEEQGLPTQPLYVSDAVISERYGTTWKCSKGKYDSNEKAWNMGSKDIFEIYSFGPMSSVKFV